MREWILPIAAAIMLLSCSGGARVDVRNASSAQLTDVHVVARGTTVEVGDLGPGETRSIVVCPKGESSLTVRFRADGSERAAPAGTYLECRPSYELEIEIRNDLSARARYSKQAPTTSAWR